MVLLGLLAAMMLMASPVLAGQPGPNKENKYSKNYYPNTYFKYCEPDGSKYYGNWQDSNIATPDATTKKQVHLHKIYLDTSTGKAYYAVDATTLKEIDGGDVAMTTSEVDAAVAAAK